MISSLGSMRPIQTLTFLILALFVPSQVAGQSAPQTISFQGFLTDPGGSALTDTLQVVFTLYDSTSTSVWTETHPTMGVIDGVFLVRLGSITPFQLLWNQPYELGVAVAGDPEMVPRTPLDSAPYLLTDLCPVTMVECTSGCTSLVTDVNNCGACENVCVTGATCNIGSCECPLGDTACPSGCTDLQADLNNCGSCNNVCITGASCSSGTCVCPTGQAACGGGCTDLASDPNNCGQCGRQCLIGESCNSGFCQ